MKRFISQLFVLISLVFVAASCQKAPFLTLNTPRSFTFTRDGGTQSITFTCNRDWSVSSSESWIQVSPSSGTASDGEVTLKITCAANTTYDPRSATVTIKVEELSEAVSISQDTGLGLIVSPKTLELTNAEQTIEIEVQKNVQYTVAIDNESSAWIKLGGTKALTTDKVTFTIEANTSYDNREGKITFKQLDGNLSETVVVRQSQTNGLFITTPDYSLSNEAHTLSVEVKANVEFDVTSQADWVTYVETKALKASTIVLSIPANEGYDNRTGTVLVKQKNGDLTGTITITQKQTDYLEVTPTSFDLDNQQHEIELKVTQNVAYSVVIPDDAKSWVYVPTKSATKGLVEDTVRLVVDANSTYDDRETSVTIKQNDGSLAGTVAIKQAYGEGLIPEKTTYDIGREGGTIEVPMKANVEYEVAPEVDWIHHVETKALSSSTIVLNVDKNELYSSREGTVSIKKKDGSLSASIVVKQAQKIAVTSVVIDKAEVFLSAGETCVLKATVTPNNATEQTVIWTSSDDSVVKVDESGNITALKMGKATISAKAEDMEGTCSVYVECVPDNQIRYTMKNGQYTERNGQLIALSAGNRPHTSSDVSTYFGDGVSVVSHVYENGVGIVTFNKPLKTINHFADGIIYYMDKDRLISIILPDSITEIGYGAFMGCKALNKVHLPGNIKKLSSFLFQGCALTTVDIPDSVEEIEDNPFHFCSKLESFSGKYVSTDKRCLVVDGTIKSFAYAGYEGSYTIPEGITIIGSRAFALFTGSNYYPNITSIILPSSITNIESFAFENNRKAESIEMQNGVKEIGYAAFDNCISLKEIHIPSTVSHIGEYAFEGCSSLTEIEIPNGVTTIGSYTFKSCTSLKAIHFPASLTTIGGNVTPGLSFWGNVFEGCTSLNKCYFKSNNPPRVFSCSFPNSIKAIYVPVAAVNDYKNAEWWKDYSSIIQASDDGVPEAIDLGLSVKWASFNLGAVTQEEYGNYYAWGEIETKENYSWETYKWCKGTYNTLTKYNTNKSFGTVDNKTVLEAEDDVAAVKLGGNWRIPTDEEWVELRQKCTWVWETQNGVKGRRITGPNGNSIFLPAAGYRINSGFDDVSSDGLYWSSSLYFSTDTERANYWAFNSQSVVGMGGSRFLGLSVRPVKE